jgi:hypothetical protein
MVIPDKRLLMKRVLQKKSPGQEFFLSGESPAKRFQKGERRFPD